MTLNTFHFAGRGEMNVTLGIPRLREILMMASKNIKTPSMEIPFKKSVPNLARQSNKVRLKLTKCCVSDVLERIKIERKLKHQPKRELEYGITVEYLPHRCYKNEFGVQPKDVLAKTETVFFKELFREIKRAAKATGSVVYFKDEVRQTRGDDSRLDEEEATGEAAGGQARERLDLGEMHESSDEDEPAEDADATTARSVSRHRENREYDDPDDEEQEPDVDEDRDENEAAAAVGDQRTEDDDDDWFGVSSRSDGRKEYEQRRKDVVDMYQHADEYDYDVEKSQWCKLKFWVSAAGLVVVILCSKVDLWCRVLCATIYQISNNF